MSNNLCYLLKSLPNFIRNTKYANGGISKNILTGHFYSKQATPPSPTDFKIIDVDFDKMMNEDDEFASNFNKDPQPQLITPKEPAVAPIDVNGWIDEELEKGGTIYMEDVEKLTEEIHYPEPSKERTGYYEFEGIKIWLPQKMLTPATYRYRRDEGEEETLPDDIRICKFEKCKPSL